MKTQGRRSSTRNNYHTVWKLFIQFYIRLNKKPDTWEDRLILFVGFLIENGRKSSTGKNYISAIKAVLQEDNVIINIDRCLINSLTKACKYQNDTVRTRLPITRDLLPLLLRKIDNLVPPSRDEYLCIMYKLLLSTAYFGLFHVGEITESPHVIKARDVHVVQNKKKMMFVLHTSKTHWKDVKPQVVKISSGAPLLTPKMKPKTKTANDFCAFLLLQSYMRIRRKIRNKDKQFFVFRDRSPVKPDHMRKILWNALAECGLDPMLYGCHSTRAGRAMDLLQKMHLDVSTIKKLGRWSSNIVYSYLKN